MNHDGKYTIGKCNYYGRKPKIHLAEVEWSLTADGSFSASAHIWNSTKTNYVVCAQIHDELAELFPNDKKLQRMIAIWKRWHLNASRPGSPRQMEFIKHLKEAYPGEHFDYDSRLRYLEAAGLSPDEEFLHNGKPYVYGSHWVKEEIPQEVIDEIMSW